MNGNQTDLWQLADRIRGGDTDASEPFLEEFQRQMSRMIRRHMRTGRVPPDLERWIAAAMNSRSGDIDGATSADCESFAREAALRIGRATLQAVRLASPAHETIRGS